MSGTDPYQLVFDGGTDYVELGSGLNNANDFSFEVWLRPANAFTSRRILSNSASTKGIRLSQTSAGKLQFYVGTTPNCLSEIILANGAWYFVSGSFDSGTNTARLFVNGVEECSFNTATSVYFGSTATMQLGRNTMDTWQGGIGEFRFYDSVIGEADFGVHRDATVHKFEVPPAAPSNLWGNPRNLGAHVYWKDNASNETGFVIEVSTNGVNYTAVGSVGWSEKAYTVSGLTNGVTHWLRVRAYNAAGVSEPSNVVSVVPSTGLMACPTNYIAVPGDAEQQTADFCVARYEMKAVDGSSNLINGGNGNVAYNASYVAQARPDGTPWVNITQAQAAAECADLGGGYSLISNAQWQTIARNIENWASNWSNGVVGNGSLNYGHTDTSPSTAIEAYSSNADPATVDLDPYYATGNSPSSGPLQKRTHVLSNGETIWDFAGNAWEWVIGTTSTANFPGVPIANYIQYTSAHFVTGSANKLFAGPLGDFGSTQGVGQFIIYTSGTEISRGGRRGMSTNAGVNAMEVRPVGYTSSDNGFRCVWNP